MRKNLFLFFTVIAVSLAISIANTRPVVAIEGALVKVMPIEEGGKKSMQVDPYVLTVKKNTIVVWMNGIEDQEIQIIFKEGKICRDITANPNQQYPGFFMNAKNCYVTSFLPYMETSTLQFPEEGHFDYSVATKDDSMKATGSIDVVP